MADKEQRLMQSSIKSRARVITKKHEDYLFSLKAKRLLIQLLILLEKNKELLDSQLEGSIHEQIHEFINKMRPVLNEMNLLHSEQRRQKNLLRQSYKTPLTKIAESKGLSEKNVQNLLRLTVKKFPDATQKQCIAFVKALIQNHTSIQDINQELVLVSERSKGISDATRRAQKLTYREAKYQRRIKRFADMAELLD